MDGATKPEARGQDAAGGVSGWRDKGGAGGLGAAGGVDGWRDKSAAGGKARRVVWMAGATKVRLAARRGGWCEWLAR
ncbi:hypothetical protein LWC34_41175 [Kibdelosporangium philippinense]|uniref:Uncharacterized protein n=1 Tax=Kibdelosporangium philippinense TaxID=211113 RepID=A0ABS8ZRY2_9PSEU|nr:hypothetical protein [Kibdelosporangium philippinense]MCE7009183.1 hypothetical protein [Kibdelosporangium philippinense]